MKLIHAPILALALVAAALTSPARAHSPAFTPEFVTSLVQPYLAVQTSLAADQLHDAKAGAAAFLEAMQQAPRSGDAARQAAALTAPAQIIAVASDIATARTEFLALSTAFTSLVEHVGTTHGETLYVAHCPMAFGNRGADWVQASQTLANPYYGASMLRCGTIKKEIGAPKPQAAPAQSGCSSCAR